MTTRSYPQWTPEPEVADPLSEQVASRETEEVQRDPEAATEGEIIRVFNGREPGVLTDVPQVDHSQPLTRSVDVVEQRGHLDTPPPSTDPFSDDQLGRLEGVPHHRGILRGHDDRGRERFEIRFRESGRIVTQPISARSLDAADEALAEALAVPGREVLR